MAIGTYISIITLNVNGLNAPIKRHRLAEWTQKQDPYVCCLQETHFRPQDTSRLKVRGWKNIFHSNGKQKKVGVAILISDKIDLKIKITRDKEGHYIMIKGSVQKEDMRIVNIYAPNILWYCLSLGLECKLTFSSPVASAEFSKYAGVLSATLSQHHLSGFEIAQLEFHHLH